MSDNAEEVRLKSLLKDKGNEFFRNGDYALATAMYKKYVKLPHPDNKNAYYNLGLCYFKMQNYEDCIKACKEAIELDSNYDKAYYRLAHAYIKTGDDIGAMLNARKFCLVCKNNKESSEYKEMNEIFNKNKEKIMASQPNAWSQKQRKIFSLDQKAEEQVSQGLIGSSWKKVEQLLRQERNQEAVNWAYFLINNSVGEVEKQKGRKKLTAIKNCILLGINPALQQEQQCEEIEQVPLKQAEMESPASESTAQPQPQKNESIKAESLSNEKEAQIDAYEIYFQKPLQKKGDVFQGFFTVLKGVILNKTIDLPTLLIEIATRYEMFSPLQMSLSTKQKKELRNLLTGQQVPSETVEKYCS